MPEPARPNLEQSEIARGALRKVSWRIVPLLFLLYLIAYLDRANTSFAKLKMKDDLVFSETIFGWGIGLLFAGYLFLEIPGALLVERWSAEVVRPHPGSLGGSVRRQWLWSAPPPVLSLPFLLGLAVARFFLGVIGVGGLTIP